MAVKQKKQAVKGWLKEGVSFNYGDERLSYPEGTEVSLFLPMDPTYAQNYWMAVFPKGSVYLLKASVSDKPPEREYDGTFFYPGFDRMSPQQQSYFRRVAKNILPLSKEKYYLLSAMQEWIFIKHPENVHITSMEDERTDCQLCEQPEIVFNFRIRWRENRERHLWVGSSCIDRFEILMVDYDGRLIPKSEQEETFKELREQARKKRIYEILQRIGDDIRKDPDKYKNKETGEPFKFSYSSWKYSVDNHRLTINQVKALIGLYNKSLGDENRPALDEIKLFSVNLRKKAYKEQLKRLTGWQWAQYSPIIKKEFRTEENGFTEEKRKQFNWWIEKNPDWKRWAEQ